MPTFEAIYRAYADAVYRYSLSLTHDVHLAEDLTSETFVRVIDRMETYRGEAQIRVWLCQIAKHLYIDHLRRTDRLTDVAIDRLPDPARFDEDLEVRDQAARIRAAVRDLRDPYGEVFRLRHLGELDYRTIGRLFGRSANWACVTYHRARAMVRETLEDPHDAI